MALSGPFELTTYALGALPLVQHFLDRLKIGPLLEKYVPTNDRRVGVPHAATLGLVLRNLIMARRPLYGLPEWAASFDPRLLGLDRDSLALLNDDRAGRALDRLFDADRASLLTTVVVGAIREFQIDVDRFHNDSTSITFSGQYAQATGRRIRGKKAAAIRHGHNKDHRPDLKQLLWILTTSADGAVPVHYRVCDGNTNDDVTHIDTWETLRRLVGRPDFLYVADCKLCSRTNMDHIAGQKGRFITVLPRSRKEDAWFREYVQEHELPWKEALRRPNPHSQEGHEDIWRVVEAPLPSAEGYRVVWVWSTLLALQQQRSRFAAVEKAFRSIESLNHKLTNNRSRLRDRAAVEQAVASALVGGIERWVQVKITEEAHTTFKQKGPGRPGPKTSYVRHDNLRFRVESEPKVDMIAYDAKTDGLFPLITNDRDMPAADVLLAYKQQPYLEKRHEQLKSVYAVAPVFLKNEGRIEALLFLYFFAMLVQALIERELRRAMATAGLDVLPLYPEERECRSPTANRLFEIFEPIQRHELAEQGEIRQTFGPNLSPLHEDLLQLLGLHKGLYAQWT